MLRLRKILLCNYLYIIIIIVVGIITLIRLNNSIIYNSPYTGTITKITKLDNKTSITINDKVIGTTYKNIDINLGDKIKVYGEFNNNYISISKYKIISKNRNIYYSIKKFIISTFNNRYLYTFILGDKSYLDKSVVRSYQENGISHLFAISGMHISLLVLMITRILKIFKFNEYSRFKITSIILFLYLILVGFSPSILRGVLFYFLFTINNIYYFYIKKINLFILVVSIALLINPRYVYDLGFLYSYSISFSLLIFSDYLKGNYIISLLKVSLIANLVSIPITLYSFNQINLLSILYNLVYVPFISFIVFPFTLIILIIKPLESIYNLLIIMLENTSLFLSNINLFKLTFKELNIFVYIIYFIIIFIFLFRRKKEYLYILLILLVIHFFLPSSDHVEFINVGQGDSTLISLNNKTYLIDTGGNRNREVYYYNLKPVLKKNGVKRIDYLILTHGDYDHMGEAINLVNNFKVEKVIFNCGEFNDLEQDLIKVLDKKNIPYYSCIKELNIDNNKLYFLQTKEYDNENDNSNVIYTEIDGYKFMFMGDASIEREKDILDEYELNNIDVLKVGHHGSKSSSSELFINSINPKYSIISVGKNNYGHPNTEVLKILSNSKIYRTDKCGNIVLKINNKLGIECMI